MRHKNWVKGSKRNSVKDIVFDNLSVSEKELESFNMAYVNSHHPKNMSEAVRLAQECINNGYSVQIFGDYDADGITSSAILAFGMKKLGITDIVVRIPDRLTEGYGTPGKFAEEIKPHDKMLVIFVDNGIKCNEAVSICKDRGFKTIILDHHEGDIDNLPDADVIVDTRVLYSTDDFRDYCGAGLAYLFISTLTGKEYEDQILPMAAIGTVADVMPLVADNYAIVKYGLKIIDKHQETAGLVALFKSALPYNKYYTAKDIGFTIGPIINAQSRINGKKGAYTALSLLLNEKNDLSIYSQADDMINVNNSRKELKTQSLEEAYDYLYANFAFDDNVLSIYCPKTSVGIIGITAGGVMEKKKKPCFVFTDGTEPDTLKGSGRSANNYDMEEGLRKFAEAYPDIMVAYGGHPEACGLTIKKSGFNTFAEYMAKENVGTDTADDSLEYDIEMSSDDFYNQLDSIIKDVTRYAPFGNGNHEIRFRINGFSPEPNPNYVNKFMKGTSIKLYGHDNVDVIGFGFAEDISDTLRKCDIIATIKVSWFRNETRYDLELIDIKDTTGEKVFNDTSLASLIRAKSKEI